MVAAATGQAKHESMASRTFHGMLQPPADTGSSAARHKVDTRIHFSVAEFIRLRLRCNSFPVMSRAQLGWNEMMVDEITSLVLAGTCPFRRCTCHATRVPGSSAARPAEIEATAMAAL
jgi:hypothetical protein